MSEARDVLEVDVLFVGGGPAGLAGALRLTQLLEATQPGLLREEMPSLLGAIDAAAAPPAAPAPPTEALGATVGVAADDGTQVIPVPPRGTAAVVDAPRGRTRS